MTYLWIALTYILTITTHYICTSDTRKMTSYNEEIKPNDQSIFFQPRMLKYLILVVVLIETESNLD